MYFIDSNLIGDPTVTDTLAAGSPVPRGVSVANGVGAVLVMIAATYIATAEASSALLGYASIVCYLTFSVLIDTNISASGNAGKGQKFEPACAVILVELGKLIVSCVLYTVARWKPTFSEGQPFIQENFSMKDAVYLAFPGLLFAINNMLVWLSIGHNEMASFGVFRDTIIFFNAAIWCVVFRSTLGLRRNLALCMVFVGLCVNQIGPLLTSSISPMVLLVLLMAFTNAVASVANEFAIKQNSGLDLNLQNAVLYSFCLIWAIVYIVVSKPQKLTSFAAFFENFGFSAWLIVCMQLSAGLLVSRILKYADSITKNVACALRGPILIFLAPVCGLHSRLDFPTGLSAILVGSAACYFLMQGKPAPGIDYNERASQK